jgi:carbamoyl-phosphate synthase large subunit
LSFANSDNQAGLDVAKRLRELGYDIAATTGTAAYLEKFGQPVDRVIGKVSEVTAADTTMENAVDLITRGEIGFVVNTPQGGESRSDGEAIRKAANTNRVSSVTTVDAALAAVLGLIEQRGQEVEVRSLQEYHGR